MNKNIEVLQEVLDLLEDEKRKFYSLIDENDFRIEEIDSYLRDLSKDEEDDFKIFSPRSAENRHREQIKTDTSERKKYEEENVEYQKKIEYLKLLIDKVNIVVDNLHTENERTEEQIIPDKGMDEESYKDNQDEISVLEKEHISHQILNCVSFITPDADRAKVELTALAKKIVEN